MPGPELAFDANSLQRWEQRFVGRPSEWDLKNGPALTRAFGKAMWRWMPTNVKDLLTRTHHRLTILDIGCAYGELCDEVKQHCPNALVAGEDWSEAAVMRAREDYPACQFSTAWPERWDVTICSNVYEHVVDYQALLKANLFRSRLLHIILVPYNEWLGDEAERLPDAAAREADGWTHVWRFREEHFPAQDAWNWHWISTMLEPGPVWPGRQMMVVYAK